MCDHNHNTHCEGGCHHDGPEAGWRAFLPAALSAILLIAGIILDHSHLRWFEDRTVNLLWFVAAFLPVGIPVMKEGWEAICGKDYFNEFTLMITACVGAFCIGEYPEAAGVMLFYTVGEILQDKAVDKATRNISRLLDTRPQLATVIRGGRAASVSPKDVAPGETIEIRPGERVPLDGTLLSDEASFDTSALTGESVPRLVEKGGEVLAGMIAGERSARVAVTRPYEDSALARILRLVKDASAKKAPAEKFIRRFARVYTPAVMALAVLIVAVPALAGCFSSFHYVFSDWLYRGLVFLVISCPCALVISVPLGYFAGIGAASKAGILFKGGNYLDSLAKAGVVVFDKTGTLTTGRFDVTEIRTGAASSEELLAMAVALEKKSTHPIASAIVRNAEKKGIEGFPASYVTEIPGHGVKATAGGKEIMAGNLRMMEENGIVFPESLRHTASTVVACAADGIYAGALILSDTPRKDSSEAISCLRRLGISDIRLLSGDRKEVVEEFAEELGIAKACGALLPEGKAEYIGRIKNEGHRNVVFVGDGMNDAPVLALSDVGIAMGGTGSDAAVESADVVVRNDRPSAVATAVEIGKTTRAIVRENIIGAIAVKTAVLVLGALGHASLWAAVFADAGVALLAVLNSLRILYKRYR